MKERRDRFWLIALSTALMSYSVISYEVVLTRIFSVMLSYHYVFAILSFALLGLGLGGALLKRWQHLLPGSSVQSNAGLCALFIIISTLTIVTLPLYAYDVYGSVRTWIYIFLATVPFFFAGLTLAEIFERYAGRISIIYGFDLLGATGGAFTVVPLLNVYGGIESALFVSVIAAAGVVLISIAGKHYSFTGAVSVIGVVAVFGFFRYGGFSLEVPVVDDVNKDMYRALMNPVNDAEIVESRWSSFGRTDLVQSTLTPDIMTIFIDGAAGSAMYNLDTLLSDTTKSAHLVHHFGEFFPFFFLDDDEKDTALIIGPGGGRDVVVALLGEVKSITAVEVNPDVVQIVKDYEAFNGGIYTTNSRVDVVIGEGRNFVRTSESQYDLIMLALPVTKSSRSVEGYMLTENYLFTVEAFDDYMNHLTPEGRIIIVAHNKAEIYRVIVQALESMKKRGLTEQSAMKHIYTYSPGGMPTVVIKNQTFDDKEVGMRHKMMHLLGYDRGNFFVPHIQQEIVRPFEKLNIDYEWRMFDQFLYTISTGEYSAERLVAIAAVDISAVSDDSPFFYKFTPGLPEPLGSFSLIIFTFTILVIIVIMLKHDSRIVQATFLKSIASTPVHKIFLLMFLFLGAGFMVIEIALFQKLMLFIAQPTMALTVMLFSLLLGTGLGSISTSIISDKNVMRMLTAVTVIITLVILAYANFFYDVFASGFNPKITAVTLFLLLGFIMGFPFPLSIRMMREHNLGDTIHLMWGFNGIASVIGSALAMIMGVLFGFTIALYLGAVFYGSIVLLSVRLNRVRGQTT